MVIFSNVTEKNFPIWSLVSYTNMSLGFYFSDVFISRSVNFAAMLKIIVLVASANFGKIFSTENQTADFQCAQLCKNLIIQFHLFTVCTILRITACVVCFYLAGCLNIDNSVFKQG